MEIVLHVVTGEMNAVHRLVDVVKVLGLIGIGPYAFAQVLAGPKDVLYLAIVLLVPIAAPATVLEVYLSWGENGLTAVVVELALAAVFAALLYPAFVESKKKWKKD